MIGFREFLVCRCQITFGLSQFLLLLRDIVKDGHQQQCEDDEDNGGNGQDAAVAVDGVLIVALDDAEYG